MPCRVDEYGDPPAVLENNRLTRILCSLVENLTPECVDELARLNTEFKLWLKKHREEDRIRKEREAAQEARDQARVRAIQKLTPEELQALGLMR